MQTFKQSGNALLLGLVKRCVKAAKRIEVGAGLGRKLPLQLSALFLFITFF